MSNDINDTIVSNVTNLINQPVAIIRLSGDKAYKIINKCLEKPIIYKKQVVLKKIYDKRKKYIDNCLINCFKAPKSFTGEDIIEINCHGNNLLVKKIINTLIFYGARQAEKGEFLKKAFLNNKISLSEAKGINELIIAKNENELKIGIATSSKENTEKLINIKSLILDLISIVQTAIDYPEYDEIDNISMKKIMIEILSIKNKISNIIIFNEKVLNNKKDPQILLYGNANAGKSSIFNSLTNEENAIVSNIPGTTRDVIKTTINYKSLNLTIVDVAGINDTNNEIELIGLKKANSEFEKSDLILWVVSNLDEYNKIDLNKLKNKNYFIIFNKIDLNKENYNKNLNNKKVVYFSALNSNPKIILEKIYNNISDKKIIEKKDDIYLNSLSDIGKFKKMLVVVNKIIKKIDDNEFLDIINIDLNNLLNILNDVLGINYNDEIIDNIFKKFCLGK